MGKKHKKEAKIHFIIRYIMLMIGASLAAVAIELFLVPNTIIDGGIIGISLIINYMTDFSFGILYRLQKKRHFLSKVFSVCCCYYWNKLFFNSCFAFRISKYFRTCILNAGF